MRWIADLINRLVSDTDLVPGCLVAQSRDDVRMELFEYALPCGHTGYGVTLAYHVPEQDEWLPIALLRDFNLDASIALLVQAKQCIENLRQD
jgi:hypothetical protein